MRTQIIVNTYKFIQNKSEADTLDVFIDGDIVDAGTQEWLAYWGVETTTSYKSFRDTVLNSDAKRINIHINSGGGACADALAMHDLIKEQIANGANWYTFGKGIVASAATYPLLAAGPDRTNISENCFFMIHNVSGTISGNIDECEAGVKMMRKFNNCARDLYSSYFNKPKETIASWMNAETWWQGSEMKDMGFIKNCGPAEKALTNAIPKDKWLFSNKAILNTINNTISPSTPKNKGMKKNSIINAIEEGFKKYFTNSTTLQNAKPDDLKAAIVNAINEQEDDDALDPAAITTAVTNAMNGDAFKTLIANAVGTAVTNLLGVENNVVTTAITNATKDLVTKDALETLKNDIATKLGTTNRRTKPEGGKPENSSEAETIENMDGWNR